MPTAVLTGCNSGIGFEVAKLALKDGYNVYALDIVVGDKLKSLEGAKCKTAQVDVTNPDSIRHFTKSIGSEPVDVLFNIAGIMPDPKTEDSRDTVSLQIMQRCFAINAYGPLLLTQALLPNILVAPPPRRIAVISSRVGSISDNSSGSMYAYRASKTAVNSFFKTLAVELKEHDVVVSMLHPGFTKTNLNSDIWKLPGVVEADVAAAGLWKIVKEKSLDQTGKFWHRDDYELPW